MEKIIELIKTKDKENINLAVELLKGQDKTDLEILAALDKSGILKGSTRELAGLVALQLLNREAQVATSTELYQHGVVQTVTIRYFSAAVPEVHRPNTVESLIENCFR